MINVKAHPLGLKVSTRQNSIPRTVLFLCVHGTSGNLINSRESNTRFFPAAAPRCFETLVLRFASSLQTDSLLKSFHGL